MEKTEKLSSYPNSRYLFSFYSGSYQLRISHAKLKAELLRYVPSLVESYGWYMNGKKEGGNWLNTSLNSRCVCLIV